MLCAPCPRGGRWNTRTISTRMQQPQASRERWFHAMTRRKRSESSCRPWSTARKRMWSARSMPRSTTSKQGSSLRCQAAFCRADLMRRCGSWNLHNIPYVPGSMTRHLPDPITGINVPWLYLGMLFASFAWHNEDNYLYSINYMHWGAPKMW